MKKLTQKGFTLVELAIVLTIIGLLIGGILKGQQLMTNARVTTTAAQINAVEAATTTFRDTFNAVPGDMPNAAVRINGWTNASVMATLGDGVIGQIAWNMAAAQGNTAVAAPATVVDNETLMFWGQLGRAGLLSGVNWTGTALGAGLATFGTHAPIGKIGGGFIVGNSTGATAPPTAVTPMPGRVNPTGMVLVLTPSPTAALSTITGTQVLSPAQAAQLDRKADDGNPVTGSVQIYGFTAAGTATGCANATPGAVAYNEGTVAARDCGLFFEIQG